MALICTSGSAVLNYAPAISEAYYRQIPLVVVSADRPTEWIDQGDGQTIRQNGTLSNFIGLAIELLENPIAKDKLWYNECQLNEVGFQLSQPEKNQFTLTFLLRSHCMGSKPSKTFLAFGKLILDQLPKC